MPNQNVFPLGYSSILVENDEFEDGYCNGYVGYLKDTQPLTVKAIRTMLLEALSDTRQTADWNTGYAAGAIRGIYEGYPSIHNQEQEAPYVNFDQVTLFLNHPSFARGYGEGQEMYKTNWANPKCTVTALELLRFIADHNPNTNRYTLTEENLTYPEFHLGQFVGYLCAALFPELAQEHNTESVPVTILQEA